MEPLLRNLRVAFRQLLRNPVFIITAVAALALGIGATTAVFTVVNAVLLKPLTYPNADRIVKFIRPSKLGNDFFTSIPEFHFYERQSNVFETVPAYDMAGPGFNRTGERPEQIHGIHVSEGYFQLFGAPVMLGRTFTPQEDAPKGGKVVVLSYNLWQRKFDGDKGVLGKSLSLGNKPSARRSEPVAGGLSANALQRAYCCPSRAGFLDPPWDLQVCALCWPSAQPTCPALPKTAPPWEWIGAFLHSLSLSRSSPGFYSGCFRPLALRAQTLTQP